MSFQQNRSLATMKHRKPSAPKKKKKKRAQASFARELKEAEEEEVADEEEEEEEDARKRNRPKLEGHGPPSATYLGDKTGIKGEKVKSIRDIMDERIEEGQRKERSDDFTTLFPPPPQSRPLTVENVLDVLKEENAEEICVIDLRTKCNFLEYMITCLGKSRRHLLTMGIRVVKEVLISVDVHLLIGVNKRYKNFLEFTVVSTKLLQME